MQEKESRASLYLVCLDPEPYFRFFMLCIVTCIFCFSMALASTLTR